MSSSRNLFLVLNIFAFNEPLCFAPSPFRILEGCLEQVGRSWDICRPVFRHRSAEQRRVGGEKEGNRFVGPRFSRNTCRLALPARGLTSSSFPRKRAFLFFFFSSRRLRRKIRYGRGRFPLWLAVFQSSLDSPPFIFSAL